LLSFLVIALEVRVSTGDAVRLSFRNVFVPVHPWLCLAAAMAAGLTPAHETIGFAGDLGCPGVGAAQKPGASRDADG
jgi:hypothetical protein